MIAKKIAKEIEKVLTRIETEKTSPIEIIRKESGKSSFLFNFILENEDY